MTYFRSFIANQNVPIAISNEVVTYRSGGAVQAMREVIRRAATCPHRPVDTGEKSLPEADVPDHAVRGSAPAEGLPRRSRHRDRHDQGEADQQTSYAVYQRHGNVLSGIYSVGGANPEQLQLVLHAAEQSARNLRRGGNGASSGPTA